MTRGLLRRSLLFALLVAALGCYFTVSTQPFVVVEPTDFSELQKQETGFSNASKYRRQLDLSDYVQEVTQGKTLALTGERWRRFADDVVLTSRGQGDETKWDHRISEEQVRRDDSPYRLYFRPDEEPLAEIVDSLQRFEHASAYLRIETKGEPIYLSVRLREPSNEDFHLGTGIGINPQPPLDFLYPWRNWTAVLFVGSLAAYVLVPWERRSAEVLYVSYWRLIAGDVVAVLLFGMFFSLPMFVIGGALQSVTTPAVFLTIVLWPLSGVGLWLAAYSADLEGYQIALHTDRLTVREGRRALNITYSEVVSWQFIEQRPPRWLIGLLWLAALTGKGSRSFQAAGQAMILSGAQTDGVQLNLQDNSTVILWINQQMGARAEQGLQRLETYLKQAGSQRLEESNVVESLLLPQSSHPVGSAWKQWRERSLLVFLSLPLVVVVGGAAVHFCYEFIGKWDRAFSDDDPGSVATEPPPLPILKGAGIQWQRSVSLRPQTNARRLLTTSEGGHLIAGTTWEPGSSELFAFVAHVDKKGETVWQREYGGARVNRLENIIELSTEEFLTVGSRATRIGMYHEQRMWVQSINMRGEINWEREIITSEDDAPTAADGRRLETGQVRAWGLATRAPLVYLVDLDTTGQIEVMKSIDLLDKLSDATLTALRCTADGGCLVTGETSVGPSNLKDLLLVKLSAAGEYEWHRTFGGPRWESGTALLELQNGSCAVAGLGDANGARGEEAYLVWTDFSQGTHWEKRIARNDDQSTSQVVETSEGNILVVGESRELAEVATDASLPVDRLWWAEFDQRGTLTRESVIGSPEASLSGQDLAINDDGTWTVLINGSRSEFRSESLLLHIDPRQL